MIIYVHRVDSQKRRRLILRVVSYSVLIILTLVTSLVLLLAALGYRLDSDGEVVRSGLLLVDSNPIAADVYINGENKNDPTASQFVLPAGKYQIDLKSQGYRDWTRDVSLAASGVQNLYYPLLIPQELTPKKQLNIPKPEVVSQSPNKKLVFMYTKTATGPQLIALGSKKSELSEIKLPADFKRQGAGLGKLKVIEWSHDNRHVLAQQTVNGTSRWLSIDTKNGLNSIDITKVIGEKPISDVRYAGEDVNQIYGLSKGNLASYSLESPSSKQLLTNVKSYEPFDDQTLSFVRYNKSKQLLEAGVLDQTVATVVHSRKTKNTNTGGTSNYLKFDGVYYLVVQLDGEKKITIYQSPLREPVLADQLPLIKISFADSEQFRVSDNSQFVLFRNGRSVAVYDFEGSTTSRFKIAKDESAPEWLDSHRLLTKRADNMVYMNDYDGANRYGLVKTDYGTVMMANNYESSFVINKSGSEASLSAIPMIANR